MDFKLHGFQIISTTWCARACMVSLSSSKDKRGTVKGHLYYLSKTTNMTTTQKWEKKY